jgi:hypothetical protein
MLNVTIGGRGVKELAFESDEVTTAGIRNN